ncbi:hypothetical protein ACFL38_04460 [Candidatus Omnitrophota bacterium]
MKKALFVMAICLCVSSISFAQEVHYNELDFGTVYQVSDEILLMPELHPIDPKAAQEKAKTLEAKGKIRVLSRTKKRGKVWYFIEAHTAKGDNVGLGWVNASNLDGITITEVQ